MDDPPPMTRPALDQGDARLHGHAHAICLFDSEQDLLPQLGRFLKDGVNKNESAVFVHSFPSDEKAWEFAEEAYGEKGLRRRDVALVKLYTDAFQGDRPRIDHEHVGAVVTQLADDAARKGRSGLRIFVDASRRYFHEARVDEWFEFEEWLGRRLQAKVGLVCAYQRGDVLTPERLPRVLATHAYRFDAVPRRG